jgi:hypothetical protein
MPITAATTPILFPDWIDDPAMITGDDLWGQSAEGCHYLFLDHHCRPTATVHQQS